MRWSWTWCLLVACSSGPTDDPGRADTGSAGHSDASPSDSDPDSDPVGDSDSDGAHTDDSGDTDHTDAPLPNTWFVDVSRRSGIVFGGQSYGLGWGDINSDGWPDLWVGNHAERPYLFVNQGNGTFTDLALQLMDAAGGYQYDAHGLVWVDIDNDGDQDLIESVGAVQGIGLGANRVHRNLGGWFEEVGSDIGLDYEAGSGRCPVPVDANGDGRLDMLLIDQKRNDGQAPTALFTQTATGSFLSSAEVAGASLHPTALCGTLADLDGDRRPELVRFSKPGQVSAHDPATALLDDVSARVGLPTVSHLHDLVVADLDNDLRNDVYVARWRDVSAGAVTDADRRVRMALRVPASEGEHGVRFKSDGPLVVTLEPATFWAPGGIRVGGDCGRVTTLSFPLDPTSPDVDGVCPHTPGVDRKLYVGRDGDDWVVTISTDAWDRGNIDIRTTADVTDVQWIGVNTLPAEEVTNTFRDGLWMGSASGFSEQGEARGLVPSQCASVAAGDFDNDMDLDLFLVCSSQVVNEPNRILVNDGAGQFTVATLHGAEGSIEGRGDSVALADYDRDGDLDVFVTNGFAAAPFNNGPLQLFRNQTEGNHWLELDLVGTRSNRDAIGATVIVTAGDVQQMREVGNTTHHMASHHRRVHVGLGPNAAADEVKVLWPDGGELVLEDVAADQILEVMEP